MTKIKKTPAPAKPAASAKKSRKKLPAKKATKKVVKKTAKKVAKKTSKRAPTVLVADRIPLSPYVRSLIQVFQATAHACRCHTHTSIDEDPTCGIQPVSGDFIPCYCVAIDTSGAYLGLSYPNALAIRFEREDVVAKE